MLRIWGGSPPRCGRWCVLRLPPQRACTCPYYFCHKTKRLPEIAEMLGQNALGIGRVLSVHVGRSKFASFSTCRRKTEGRISRAVQMSKIERRDGLVFPSSIRLMKARSYPAFAANVSWLIFCCARRFRRSTPKATEGSVFGLFVLEVATPHCGTASILRAAYNSCGGRSAS